MSQTAISRELSLFLAKAKGVLLDKYATVFMSDLYIQFLPEEATLRVLDEEDREVISWIIESISQEREAMDPSELNNLIAQSLKSPLQLLDTDESFRALNLVYPFSISLVDSQMETLEELLLIDQDQVMLDNELLKNLDQELNDFLKELLSDK